MGPSKSKGVVEIDFFRPSYYISSNLLAVGPWSVPLTHIQWTIHLFTRRSWYNSALFGADQAWSGYYERDDSAPVVWATAQ